MNKLIILSLLFFNVITAYSEQSFQVKFYRKNGLAPLKYNIYDINKIDFNKLSDKYNMVIQDRKSVV